MAAAKLRVIATRRLPDPVEARLAKLFAFSPRTGDAPLGRAALGEAMQACDALVATVTDPIDATLIADAGERLRLIANFGVGTDHVDLGAARARGLLVTNTPDVLTEDTADLIMALILAAMRGLGSGERTLRAGGWTGWAPTNLMGRSLTGKALGIVGMGRIGRALAKRARACGMRIHYHNRHRLTGPAEDEAGGARFWPNLDDMLAAMDAISLCCPYSAETHHMIGARRLASMPRHAFLINAARGAIVDQDALIAALEQGTIAGAALDVYPNEPEIDPRLVALPNATLLPHLGSATIESRTAMGDKVIANILAFAEGRDLPDRVA